MAAESPDTDADAAPTEARECSPCRGTGSVVSGLGGVQSTISCPWCEGTGRTIPAHDAQARWRAERGDEDGGAPSPGVE